MRPSLMTVAAALGLACPSLAAAQPLTLEGCTKPLTRTCVSLTAKGGQTYNLIARAGLKAGMAVKVVAAPASDERACGSQTALEVVSWLKTNRTCPKR